MSKSLLTRQVEKREEYLEGFKTRDFVVEFNVKFRDYKARDTLTVMCISGDGSGEWRRSRRFSRMLADRDMNACNAKSRLPQRNAVTQQPPARHRTTVRRNRKEPTRLTRNRSGLLDNLCCWSSDQRGLNARWVSRRRETTWATGKKNSDIGFVYQCTSQDSKTHEHACVNSGGWASCMTPFGLQDVRLETTPTTSPRLSLEIHLALLLAGYSVTQTWTAC